MNDIDFSIIFNSRGRVSMLTKMLDCVNDTCSDIEKLEVIVNFDDDDHESLSVIDDLSKRFKYLRCLVNPREKNIHVNVNKMAFISKGKYIWALGDDCHIMTKGWDTIAKDGFEDAFKKYPDKVILGAVNSTSVDKELGHMGWYCDAPILTREGLNGMGYLIHPHFMSLGADVATWKVYSSVNRIIDLRNICFDHVTHNTVQKVINPDKTAYEYRARQRNEQVLNPFTFDYSEDIKRIKDLIGE